MDDAFEFWDNANVSTAPLLSASGSEAAGDSSTDQSVNNAAQTFAGAAQVMTTTSDVDVDRITERNHSDTSRNHCHAGEIRWCSRAIGVGVGLSISDAYDGMEQEKTDNSLFWSRYNAELVEKYVR